jgi:hypothetical protein
MITVGCLVVLAIYRIDIHGAEPAGRSPAPDAAAVTKSKQVLKDVFKSEYAKSKPMDRAALAKTLLAEAAKASSDPTGRYVMLVEARDLAASTGDVETAIEAVDRLIASYEVNAGEARVALATQLVRSAPGAATARAVVEALFPLADELLASDEWQQTAPFLRAVETVARRTQDSELLGAVRAGLKEAEAIQSEFEKLDGHLATLKQNPDDPAANLAVGRFRCFIRRDWEAGALLLVKAADEAIKAAVKADMDAAQGDANQQLAAADAWYALVAGAPPSIKGGIQARAHHWYKQASAGLTGLSKGKAEKRARETGPTAGVPTPNSQTVAKTGKPIRMLAAFDPERDVVAGEWKSNRLQLVGPTDITMVSAFDMFKGGSRIQIPCQLTEPYRLNFDVERVAGNGGLMIGFIAGGEQRLVVVDDEGKCLLLYKTASGGTTSAPIPLGASARVCLVVLPGKVHVEVNGKRVLGFGGSEGWGTVKDGWKVPDSSALIVGTHGATFRFRSIELAPVDAQTIDAVQKNRSIGR